MGVDIDREQDDGPRDQESEPGNGPAAPVEDRKEEEEELPDARLLVSGGGVDR
jgi:hypothetical protein